MASIEVKITVPTGGTSEVELPDDVPISDIIPELVTALSLPTVANDGQPVSYKIHNKDLGRELSDNETLASAGLGGGSSFAITQSIIAGEVS